MTQWSEWKGCKCGYGGEKTRTRTVHNQSMGKGKACKQTAEKGKCIMTPCDCTKVRPGYYGDRCDQRDCVWHQWSSWSNTCSCPKGYRSCKTRIVPTKRRSRTEKITKAGQGKSCTGTGTENSNCGFVCILKSRCFAYGVSDCQWWYEES